MSEERVVEQFVLRGDTYELVGRHGDSVSLHVVAGVAVDLREVW